MEADWEVELGADSPVIEADWTGFVDLARYPESASQLPEAAALPALADALIKLNAASSRVWTTKCDVWQPDTFDPDEMGAPAGAGNCAVACYIDVLPRAARQWTRLDTAVAWCKAVCFRMHQLPLRCSRADLVVRRAFLAADQPALAITAYLSACGATSAEALAALSRAICAFAGEILCAEVSVLQDSKLQ